MNYQWKINLVLGIGEENVASENRETISRITKKYLWQTAAVCFNIDKAHT